MTQTSAEWRRSLSEVDASVFKHLREQIKGGFDEERFSSRVGFLNLKRRVRGPHSGAHRR